MERDDLDGVGGGIRETRGLVRARVLCAGGAAICAFARVLDRVLFAGAEGGGGASRLRRLRRLGIAVGRDFDAGIVAVVGGAADMDRVTRCVGSRTDELRSLDECRVDCTLGTGLVSLVTTLGTDASAV